MDQLAIKSLEDHLEFILDMAEAAPKGSDKREQYLLHAELLRDEINEIKEG